MTPLKRIHAKLVAAGGSPDSSTEELVDALIAAWEELHRERRETRASDPPVRAADYHRQPHWVGGVIGWAAPAGSPAPTTGAASPAIASMPARRQAPAEPA